MRSRRLIAAVVAISMSVAVAACGSSSDSSSGSPDKTGDSSGGADIHVGVITSLTGPYSSSFLGVEKGVKARIAAENAKGGIDGHKITYTLADDTSTPAGALSATQKLIKQDHVFAILDASPLFFGGAQAAKAASVPVIGSSVDSGPEWVDKSYTTFFDSLGYMNRELAATTYGEFFKSQGCTKVGGVANSGAASTLGLVGAVASAKHADIQTGYVNTKLAAGSTDVGPEVLGLKNSGTDCIYLPVVSSVAFALVEGLKQVKAPMKAVVLATGYGQALLQNAAAAEAGQGVFLASQWTPVEAKTDATEAMQDALKTYAGTTDVPDLGVYMGWSVADLFIYGMKQAGGGASQDELVSKLRASNTWDDGGLYGSAVDFADPAPVGSSLTPGNCIYIVKLTGSAFEPVENASPLCGDIIEGVKNQA